MEGERNFVLNYSTKIDKIIKMKKKKKWKEMLFFQKKKENEIKQI